MTVRFKMSCLFAVGLLFCSISPGAIGQHFLSIFLVSLVVLPCVLIAGLFELHKHEKSQKTTADPPRRNWRQKLPYLMLFTITVSLLMTSAPTRIALCLCRDKFEDLLNSAPEFKSEYACKSKPEPRRVGFFQVDTFGADPRGGVYFRTSTGVNVIDQLSWGIAYQPNNEGSPFGNAHYFTDHLFGDWHSFSVSDDY